MPSTGREAELDRGSSIVEFSVLAAVLIVPLMVFVGVLAQAQAAAFAAVSAAQQGAQVLATQPVGRVGAPEASAAARLAAADYGVDAEELSVGVDCLEGDCTRGGSVLQVTATTSVALPELPLVGRAQVVRMEHRAVVRLGRYA